MQLLVFFSNVIKNKWATMSQLPHKFQCEECRIRRGSGRKGAILSGKALAVLTAHLSGYLEPCFPNHWLVPTDVSQLPPVSG